MIFFQLQLSSKVCLATTCKFFCERFEDFLDNLTFPHLDFDSDGKPYKSRGTRDWQELLLRLQGRRQGQQIQYCRGCLRLHPSCEFSFFSGKWSPLGAYCTLYGIVALCCHGHLNARQKVRLIEKLETGTLDGSNKHECVYEEFLDKDIIVNITIIVSSNGNGPALVDTRYIIIPNARIIAGLESWRMMSCPHINLYDCLRHPNHAEYNCRFCQTRIRVAIYDDQSEVQVTRNLGGKGDPAGKVWQDQCEMGYSFLYTSERYVEN